MLEALLRLLHPLMPFITEEIWEQVAPRAGIEGDTIMLQAVPRSRTMARSTPAAEGTSNGFKQFILGIRQIRGEMDISPGKALPVMLAESADDRDQRRADRACPADCSASAASNRSISLASGRAAAGVATALLGDMRLLVPMKGLIDVEAERARLGKQKQTRSRPTWPKARGKLDNENFVNNAPPTWSHRSEAGRTRVREDAIATACEEQL